MDSLNILPNTQGNLVKRRGWRGFKSMVRELDRANKLCRRYGYRTTITVDLPLKGSMWLKVKGPTPQGGSDGE